MGKTTRGWKTIAISALGLVLSLAWGCAGTFTSPVAYYYFSKPPADDPWSHKIELWQTREKSEQAAPNLVVSTPAVASGADPSAIPAQTDNLRSKYDLFRQASKRALAREVAEWIQQQAKDYYVPDGPIDQWATLEETFETNGDDCDGLELLVYSLLRDV